MLDRGDVSGLRRHRLLLFCCGLLFMAAMVARSRVQWDQLQLLARGWLLAAEGSWTVIGNATSAGGYEPGGFSAILVGLPLMIWMDARSPVVLIACSHVVAWLLLDRVVARTAGERARVLFALVYWLNPWRVYFSGFLWNPNYFFVVGAIHLAACWRQRDRPRFGWSLALVAVTGLSAQLHPEAMIPVVAAVLLWIRGYWRPHWGGVAIGALITVLAVLPWIAVVAARPDLVPGGEEGYPFRGLVTVAPVIKGVNYWLRYGSLWVSSKWMARFDFTSTVGESADAVLSPLFYALTWVIGPLTLLVPIAAAVFMFRRRRQHAALGRPGAVSGRVWLHGYVSWTFLATVIMYAASPTTVMMWQGLVVMHAAVLPLVLWIEALLRTRAAAATRRVVTVTTAVTIALLLAMTFGSQMYRDAGRASKRSRSIVFTADHPLLHDFGFEVGNAEAIKEGSGPVDIRSLINLLRVAEFPQPDKLERESRGRHE